MKIIINNYIEKKLILLQRNELQNTIQRKIRKLFGRYLFTSFFIYFFNTKKTISKNISKIILNEFEEIKPYLHKDINQILDIGAGLGLIDILLNNYLNKVSNFTLIDRNFISKKIKYGFSKDYEGYNLLKKTEFFLIRNGLDKNQIKLIDTNHDINLINKFDLIISLISMGYHYPVDNYLNILKHNSHKETIFIFDLADEHNKVEEIKILFEKVHVLKVVNKRHKQIRVICKRIKE